MKKLVIIAFLILAFGVLILQTQAKVEVPNNTTIVVTGEAMISAKPDIATVCLGVETESENVTKALNENSEKLAKVISALEGLGISEDNITTTYFKIYPVRDYKTNELKGYRVVNEIKVKTSNLDKIGKIISMAISSGANRVEWIEFGLSKDKVKKLRAKVIKDACEDAKAKAEAIAEGLNLTIVGILNVEEQSTYFRSYKVYGSELGAIPIPTQAVATPPIKPGEVTVSFKIVATFIAQ